VQRLDGDDRLVCIADVDRGMDPGSEPRAAVPGEDR
jgi:hypothetical protein